MKSLCQSIMKPLLAAALVCVALPASAHEDDHARHFPATRLEPALDTEGMGNVNWAGIPEHLSWDAGLLVGYENDPLYVFTPADAGNPLDRGGVLVENRLHAHAMASIALFEWVQLGVDLPVLLYQGRDSARVPESDGGEELGTLGVGDLRLLPKVRVLRQKSGQPLDLAVLMSVTLPTGQFADYFGSETFTFAPEIAASRTFGRWKLAANVAHRFREDITVGELALGNELLYRVGVGYVFDVTPERPTEVSVNLSGAAATNGFFRGDNNAARNPLEVIGEVEHKVWGPINVFVGGGAGIQSNYGTPDFRIFTGVRLSSRPPVDEDGDGFIGDADRCPKDAETKNGYQDDDGCPDAGDADKDGIADDKDTCPAVPEDKDGFEDDDGCPDIDDDKDGIKNDVDACPKDAEDKDGHDDQDGCPDPDDDGDGVPDVSDACLQAAEDKDGFEDSDGCPDNDNDKDGVADAKDQCRDEAGIKENRGCPDKDRDGDTVVDRLDNCPDEAGSPENGGCAKKQLVVLTASKLEIKDKVFFKTGKDVIEKKSFELLDNVSAVLQAHPEIAKVQVEGHTDNVGDAAKNKDLSDRRAKSVVKYLTDKGVDAARLVGVGFGLERPIADNATEDGKAQNRRVEFVIVE